MARENQARLRGLLVVYETAFRGNSGAHIETALHDLERDLGGYDATTLRPAELYDEWGGLIGLYRAVRQGHGTMHAALRSSDVSEQLTRLYYTLRSIQGSLSMAYVVARTAAEPPETSPLGTAIGLFDAPKILAQETHLRSGSYDAVLPYFVRWMQEIREDMAIRTADYLHFYGEAEVAEARAALRRILGLREDGELRLLELQPGGADDPVRALEPLLRGQSADLASAAYAIQEAGHEARMRLVSFYAEAERYRALLGGERASEVEATLQRVLTRPFPVGETPLFDLAAEQEKFDTLLSESPQDLAVLRDPTQNWAETSRDALRQACTVEQSLRDHPDAYRERYQDPRFRRSFRWYIWEFLSLAQRSAPPGILGARPRG